MPKRIVVALTLCLGTPLAAQSLSGMLSSDSPYCFARSYDAAHLAAHPNQLVTSISISQHPEVPQNADDGAVLLVQLTRRGSPEVWSGAGYCQIAKIADCGMEGDAGAFTIEPRGADTVLLKVGRYGMSFEGASDFLTLHSDQGDDREFLLHLSPASACQ